MTASFTCGGVMVLPRPPEGLRVCYVALRGLEEELRDVVYRDGRRPLAPSIDHRIPRSRWIPGTESTFERWTHLAHTYCQDVQRNRLGNATRKRRGYYQTDAWREANQKGNRNQPREAKVRGGRNQPREAKVKGSATRKARGDYQTDEHRTASSRGGRIGGPVGGRRSQELHGNPGTPEGRAKGNHNRWHENRGITNPDCSLCKTA